MIADTSRSKFRLALLLVLTALATLVVRNGARGAGTFDVKQYGALGNGATDDSAAIQRANDAAALAGGGQVYFPPGNYIASGIVQDSNVEFAGTLDAVIKHPNGTSLKPVIRSRVNKTTGSMSAGSKILSITAPLGVVPGARIAVRGAGGASSTQFSNLSTVLGPSSGVFTLANSFGFSNGSTYAPNFLLIDKEIVSYGFIRANTVWGVHRGLYGTPRATHLAGARVSQLNVLYASVVSVGTNSIELDQPARFTVRDSVVSGGVVGMAIRNLTINGNRQSEMSGGYNPFPVLYELADSATVSGCTILNGPTGAVRFDLGTTRSTIENNILRGSGEPMSEVGAAVWLFHGSSNNLVRNNIIDGDSVNGVYIDDRTVASMEWDGDAHANTVEQNTISMPRLDHNAAVAVLGSSENIITGNQTSGAVFGVYVYTGGQAPVLMPTDRNVTSFNALVGHKYGIWVNGNENRFVQNSFSDVMKDVVDEGAGNSFQ